MSATLDRLFPLLAARGERSLRVANVVTGLVRRAFADGELVERLIPDCGVYVKRYVPPMRLFERVVGAADAGAFERYSDDEIVDHIMATPDGARRFWEIA